MRNARPFVRAEKREWWRAGSGSGSGAGAIAIAAGSFQING